MYYSKVNISDSSTFTNLVLLFTGFVIVNIVTLNNPANLLLTIPQYIIVLFFLVKNNIRDSVLSHFAFTILSLSAQKTLGMFETEDFLLYNYGTLKLIGPIRACYAMNLVFTLILLHSKLKVRKDLLYYKLYKVFLCLFIPASIIGVIGVALHPFYTFDKLLDKEIYAYVVLTSMYIILKVANDRFIQVAYYICLSGIMAGIFGSFFCFITGLTVSHYSVFDIAYMSDITYLTPMLIIGVIMVKQRALLLLTLVIYFFFATTVLAGKEVFSIAFCLFFLLYCYFFRTGNKKRSPFVTILMFGVVGLLVGLVIHIQGNTGSTMASYKLHSAFSMMTGNIDDAGRSPYIRMAQLANILYEGLQNPFLLIFGNGYGGYFEDKLGLFANVDLLNGAYNFKTVGSGRFHSGHDAVVNIPFFNGLVGMWLVLRISWKYIKKIRFNYMNSAIFLWVLLIFYFNTIFAYIGLFALIGAEYKVNKVNMM